MATIFLNFVEIPKELILTSPESVVIEIYKISCLVSHKSYVGQTVSHVLNHGKYRRYGSLARFKSHVSEAMINNKMKQCRYLNNAIRKYGPSNFVCEVLMVCTRSYADKLETENIRDHNTLYPNGYNLKLGGQTFVHTEHSRTKVSKGVQHYFDKQRYSKYRNIEIPPNIKPSTLIHKLNREGQQYGWYILYKLPNGSRIKIDFGGVRLDLNSSYERAVKFVEFLQTKKT